MRYYVEINGESSLDIQGLMIQSLPSISKPLMRSKQETIDGRDGDIVTKLGYSAYDKTLKIGLWGNYDINEVIAFFNQEGTITFSNEPDKYYRFTILNRDDYVSQLDKFRTCTIALHCQPYKYKLNEEAEELENEYVEQEGTSLSFNNSLVAPMEIDLKGNTLQNGTPTPSSPIPINNVSGDNDIVVCGKNVVNWDNINWYRNNNNDYTYISDNSTTRVKSSLIEVSGGTYTISGIPSVLTMNNSSPYCYDSNKTYLGDRYATFTNNTIIIPSNVKYIALVLNGTDLTDAIKTTLRNSSMQLEVGNQATPYEAYNSNTYPINLPVENLFDKDNANVLSGYIRADNHKIATSSTDKTIWVKIKPNTTYTIIKGLNSTTSNNRFRIGTCVDIPANDITLTNWLNFDNGTTTTQATITSGSNDNYLAVFLANTRPNYDEIKDTIKIGNGTEITDYAIELNKIGTYQDYFYKENDKWYLHKEIGKTIFDENSGWFSSSAINTHYRYVCNVTDATTDYNYGFCFTNYFKGVNRYSLQNANEIAIVNTGCQLLTDDFTTLNNLKTWLSTHNIIAYYVLATATNTEITYTPLIEQLESIKNAMSKEGTTNVNQVNNDAPFIINASVLSGTDSITLTNEGNTTSKPTLTITGSGVVGVYLENIQMFNISLGTNETIIIDTENMEAYYGSQLKNRQVTGDYSNFALQSGTNNLKFTGLVTNVEITNYNRWI